MCFKTHPCALLTMLCRNGTMTRMPTPPPLSSREACALLRCSRSTLNYLMLQGRIAPTQTFEGPNGKVASYLWNPSDIQRLAKERASA